jgi:simple sugar transport system permease protein
MVGKERFNMNIRDKEKKSSVASASIRYSLKKKAGVIIGKLIMFPEFTAFIALVVLFFSFSFTNPQWLTFDSIDSILTAAISTGIVAIGECFLIISGEFDLSVGSVYALVPMIFIMLSEKVPAVLALLLTILVIAPSIGLINGLITLKVRIPSFITTLGTMMLWRGIVYAIMGGFPLSYKGPPIILYILNGRLKVCSVGIFWLILVIISLSLVLTSTKYGNWVYATGGDQRAARYTGVNTFVVKMINFMICSSMAGFAGLVSLGRFRTVSPTVGEGMELLAIAAAVIGGASLLGGEGSILGAGIGAIIMALIGSALVQAGASPYWYRAFVGIILILAVVLNLRIKGMKARFIE